MFDIEPQEIITQEYVLDSIPEFFHGARANVNIIDENQVHYLAEIGNDSLAFTFHLSKKDKENAIYLYRDGLVRDFLQCELTRISVTSHPESQCMKEIYKLGKPQKHAVYIRYYVNPHSGSIAYQHGLCLGSNLIYEFSNNPCIPYYQTIKIDSDLSVFTKEDSKEVVKKSILENLNDFIPTFTSNVECIGAAFYHLPSGCPVKDVHEWLANELA